VVRRDLVWKKSRGDLVPVGGPQKECVEMSIPALDYVNEYLINSGESPTNEMNVDGSGTAVVRDDLTVLVSLRMKVQGQFVYGGD